LIHIFAFFSLFFALLYCSSIFFHFQWGFFIFNGVLFFDELFYDYFYLAVFTIDTIKLKKILKYSIRKNKQFNKQIFHLYSMIK